MKPKESRGSNRSKGFASMDEDRKKRIARQGGLASARGRKTANRGFASMDKNKQREISRLGGKAPRTTQSTRSEKNEKDAEQRDIISEKDTQVRDSDSLQEENNREASGKTHGALASSETDEDEDEGIGDGNLGRSTRGGVYGK